MQKHFIWYSIFILIFFGKKWNIHKKKRKNVTNRSLQWNRRKKKYSLSIFSIWTTSSLHSHDTVTHFNVLLPPHVTLLPAHSMLYSLCDCWLAGSYEWVLTTYTCSSYWQYPSCGWCWWSMWRNFCHHSHLIWFFTSLHYILVLFSVKYLLLCSNLILKIFLSHKAFGLICGFQLLLPYYYVQYLFGFVFDSSGLNRLIVFNKNSIYIFKKIFPAAFLGYTDKILTYLVAKSAVYGYFFFLPHVNPVVFSCELRYEIRRRNVNKQKVLPKRVEKQ